MWICLLQCYTIVGLILLFIVNKRTKGVGTYILTNFLLIFSTLYMLDTAECGWRAHDIKINSSVHIYFQFSRS